MICPRCSVGEVSDVTRECALCGFSPTGVVGLQTPYESALEAQARELLGRQFQIEGVLGRGETSVVFLALETERDRLVALKVIPRPAAMAVHVAAAFQREAQIAVALDHPHVVPIYAYGLTSTLLWYSMEYCSSRTVADQLAEIQGGRLELPAVVRIVQQVASALDYAHRRGLIHGDVRPSNVLVDGNGWARVSDFGIARALAPFTGPAGGPPAFSLTTLRYRAPEFFARHNQVGPSADQYALAVFTLECLGGWPADAAAARRSGPTPPPDLSAARPDLPFHLTDAVRRATSVRPTDRFSSVLDFAAALSAEAFNAAAFGGSDPGQSSGAAAPSPAAPEVGGGPPAPRRSGAAKAQPQPLIVSEGTPPSSLPPRRGRVFLPFALVALIGAGIGAWWLGWFNSSQAPQRRLSDTAPLDSQGFATFTPPADSAPSAASAPQPGGVVATGATPTPTPRPAAPVARYVPRPRPEQSRSLAPGRIAISSTPWGELYVDGQFVGNTPKVDLPVTGGSHRIRIVRDGFRPYDRNVWVPPGGTVRLTDIVLEELRP